MSETDTPEDTAQRLVDAIVDAGLATREELEGCTHTDLAELEAEFDVTLPPLYNAVMQEIGRDSGLYGVAMTFSTYPVVAKHNRTLRRDIDRTGEKEPPDSIFSMSYLSPHHVVFDTEDPELRVCRYSGGDPVRLYDSLEAALFDFVEHDVALVDKNSHFELRTDPHEE